VRAATYFVLAALLLTLQSVLAPRLSIGGARPDWLLVGVVFLGLYARPRDAVIGAWVLGFCADLMTLERPGLISFSYMFAAALAITVRDYLFRYWAITQFSVTLILGIAVQTLWLLVRRMTFAVTDSFWSDWLLGVLLASAYTAAWAPILHALLLRMSGLLGLPRPRYSHAGLRTVGSSDV
jgi:rod shape-determining protein MreD